LYGAQILAHGSGGLVLRPLRWLRIDGGLRLDVAHIRVRDELVGDAPGEGTLHALSPRATAEWKAHEQLRLFGAYGRGFRPPEARAFTSFDPAQLGHSEELFDGGEPAMTSADSFEIGSRWQPSSNFAAQLSGFATFIARESIFDHVSGINVELNATRRLGADLALESNPLPWLDLSADATYVDARFVESGNPIPLAPWLFGRARAVVTHENGLRGGLSFFAVAPRPLPHGATGATLAQLDATAGYHWPNWRLDLEVENVLNQRIAEGEFHFASHFRRGEPASNVPVLHYFAGPPLNARLTITAIY
jgi:outer membrane receptor protein involved in Fe transport